MDGEVTMLGLSLESDLPLSNSGIPNKFIGCARVVNRYGENDVHWSKV